MPGNGYLYVWLPKNNGSFCNVTRFRDDFDGIVFIENIFCVNILGLDGFKSHWPRSRQNTSIFRHVMRSSGFLRWNGSFRRRHTILRLRQFKQRSSRQPPEANRHCPTLVQAVENHYKRNQNVSHTLFERIDRQNQSRHNWRQIATMVRSHKILRRTNRPQSQLLTTRKNSHKQGERRKTRTIPYNQPGEADLVKNEIIHLPSLHPPYLITYVIQAWFSDISVTNKNRLESLQATLLRGITSLPWFVRNLTITNSTKIPPITDRATFCSNNIKNTIILTAH